MALEALKIKPVAPDQAREEIPSKKRRPSEKGPPKRGPAGPSRGPSEAERREELTLAEPDLGGKVHATV